MAWYIDGKRCTREEFWTRWDHEITAVGRVYHLTQVRSKIERVLDHNLITMENISAHPHSTHSFSPPREGEEPDYNERGGLL